MRVFRVAFGLMALLNATDLLVWFPDRAGPAAGYALIALWTVGGLLLTLHRFPAVGGGVLAAAGAAVVVLAGMAGEPIYSHLYLIVVIGAILALFPQEHQRLLLRVQLSIIYAFAALAKLNGTYLSGEVLEHWLEQSPLFAGLDAPAAALVTVAAMSIAAEAFIAVGMWFERTRVAAVAVGVGFHLGIVLVLPGTITLIVYAGMMFGLYWLFFDRSRDADDIADSGAPLSGSRGEERAKPPVTPRQPDRASSAGTSPRAPFGSPTGSGGARRWR